MGLSPQERQKRMLDTLLLGGMSVQELVTEFGVSEITIRRDLALLERQGKLLRVHGGAMMNQKVAYEFSFREKERRNRGAKEAIGRAAARLVEAGDAIYIDTGTTALEVARNLRAVSPQIIVTVNLSVAAEYVGQEDIRVIVAGGELGARSPDVYGELALSNLADFRVDLAFLGCDGFDVERGSSATDVRSAAVSRLMIKNSKRAYLVADSSKFGAASLYRVTSLEQLAGVVTDDKISDEARKSIEKMGVDVVVARS